MQVRAFERYIPIKRFIFYGHKDALQFSYLLFTKPIACKAATSCAPFIVPTQILYSLICVCGSLKPPQCAISVDLSI